MRFQDGKTAGGENVGKWKKQKVGSIFGCKGGGENLPKTVWNLFSDRLSPFFASLVRGHDVVASVAGFGSPV